MSTTAAPGFYGTAGPNDYPLYTVTQGARFLKMAPATLRAWFVGMNRGQFKSVVEPADEGPPLRLSFNNLAEASVLRSLRTKHDVKLSTIRQAIERAEQDLGITRLLLSKDLKAHAGELLIERFGQYVGLGASGQLALKRILDAALTRFEWEEPDFPSAIYPRLPDHSLPDRLVVLRPRRAFGCPVLASNGVTTSIISMRFNLEEPLESIAADYEITTEEVTAAIVYEEAA